MLTYKIDPINNWSELELGDYSEISDDFKEPKLIKMEGRKEVFLIPLPRPSKNWKEVMEYLDNEGYKPCKGGTNYLLGILKEFITTEQHPEVLNEKIIGSLDDEEVEVDENGYKSFFAVNILCATKIFKTFMMHETRNWFHPVWFIIVERN